MGRTRSLGIGLLAVAGIGLLVALFRSLGDERGRDASVPRIDGDSVGAELERAPVAAEAARREARGVEAEVELPRTVTKPAGEPRAPAEVVLVLSFDGRVLDKDERPLVGAEVRILGGRVLTLADESGRVEAAVELEPEERGGRGAGSIVLEIGAPGFACEHVKAILEPGVSLHLGTVRLGRGGEVRGRVFGADGKPLSAEVSWRYADERPEEEENVADARKNGVGKQRAPSWREFESDAEGGFHLRGVPEGEVFLVAKAEDHAHGWSETFVVRAGTLTELDVTLPAGEGQRVRLHGLVLDPTRRPASGVKVEVVQGRFGLFSVLSDAEGAFEGTLPVLPDAGLLRVSARDPEQRGYPAVLEDLDPRSLEQDLELVLGSPRYLEVCLVDTRGEPVPWGHVRCSGDRPIATGLVPAGREGRARVLWPRVLFSLEAMAPGFATATLGSLEPADVTSPLVVTLHPGEAVSGRVIAGGRPMPGARVALMRTGDPARLLCTRGLTAGGGPFVLHGATPVERADATTDASGRFTLTLHADGWHALVVAAEGFPLTPFGPWKLEKARGLEDVELDLRPAGAIEGRVLVPPGKTSEGRLVGVSNGWAVAHTAAADAEGFFRIEGLVPGRYQVRECVPPARSVEPLRSLWDTRLELEWDCEVRPGATTHFDLDRRGEEDFVLEGQLVLPPGSTGWKAEVWRDDGAGLCAAPVHLGADGTFRFALGKGGAVQLSITGELGTFRDTPELASGLNPWKLDPGWAELVLVGLGALQESEYLHLRRAGPGVASFEREFGRGGTRDRERILVPPGALRIQRVEFNTLQEELGVELRAGVETTFDVRSALQR